ncbi:A C2HC-type zinc-finger protein (macronuclear) [Tetrahymena thermophila SB210]|uniref:A C2HC-type zinc-finger protein n=1 Tax=Tetrahymena thermophila (strain SB210) TaxID=312017 RepID=Q23G89_TETTS|nr:A C2HC-type zinc-finger protein [Tetrahymena thermophila SB210]EAR95371.1 A C2HC-type zinc-finger protein [Tetrahymena thermophila SB210]|eukprot:XP_001015616.1 A C2HC-type zinc-finger protein [Tetrahymena thermophila SB210]
MQIHMDQWNVNNNHQFQRNQYGGANQWNPQMQSYQQYQPSSYTQQTNMGMQYPHSANQSAQNIYRPNYLTKDERKGNLALTGELALGKNNNYQQVNGGRLNYTGNMNFDNQGYSTDPYKNNNNSYQANHFNMNANQQPYMRIQQQQQQQQQQFGSGAKNINPSDFEQAQSSLRLLKQKMQNKETNNYYSKQDLQNNLNDGYQGANSQSTTNTSLNQNKQFRKVFKVDVQNNGSDTLQEFKNQRSNEFSDNEFAPQPSLRQRGSLQRPQQQQNSDNQYGSNQNSQRQDNFARADSNQQIKNYNNTNLNGSLKRDNSNNIQIQYQSSMQRTMEKKDPQMVYNSQRQNQMQNYEYQGNQDANDDDLIFSNQMKKKPAVKKPPLQNKVQPDYSQQNSYSSNIGNKKQFNSPNQGDFSQRQQQQQQQQQQPPRTSSYRGEVNGQKYYNFSKNLDTSIHKDDDDDEQENAANQKFVSKTKFSNNQGKYSSKTFTDEEEKQYDNGQYKNNYQNNNQQQKNNKLAQLNKNNSQKQVNSALEQPIISNQKVNEPSKYDLTQINAREAIQDNLDNLEECPEGCGRRFAPEALEKHAKICKKVFQQKRKKFDTKKQRINDEEHEQILQQAQMEEKMRNQYASKNKQPAKTNTQQQDKKSKWRMQSEQFRAVLRSNKGGEQAQDIPQYDDRIECPHCKRKFQESSYNKHEQICANRAKIAKASGKPFIKK